MSSRVRGRILMVALALTVTAACGTAAPPRVSPAVPPAATTAVPPAPDRALPRMPTRQFSSAMFGLAFSYPAAWVPQTYNDSSSFTDLVAYLSPQQVQDPCTRSSSSHGLEIACGEFGSGTALASNSVIVEWWEYGPVLMRGERVVDTAPGRPTVLGGRDARVTSARPPAYGSCSGVPADESISATIDRGGGAFEMTACLRGPSLAPLEAQVDAMLQSVAIQPVPH